MVKVVSTAEVSAKRKVSFWTEAVSSTFVDLECRSVGDRDSIEGELAVRSMAALEVARVSASAQSVHRTPAGITASCEDYYLVGVQTKGSCLLTQGSRSALLNDLSFALYDTTQPYTLLLTDNFEQLVIRLPRAALERYLPQASRLTALGVNANQGAARLLCNTITSLANDVDAMPAEVSLSVAQGVEHLIVAGLGGLDGSVAESESFNRRGLIQRHIMEHLSDDSLSVNTISCALHLSPSSIHRAFAQNGETVMNWVWLQRLERIRATLLSGSYRGTLADLCVMWGFSDQAHFSRAFRQRFGYPPSRLHGSG